jgi:hypothetical protein
MKKWRLVFTFFKDWLCLSRYEFLVKYWKFWLLFMITLFLIIFFIHIFDLAPLLP